MKKGFMILLAALSGCSSIDLQNPWTAASLGLVGGMGAGYGLTYEKARRGQNMGIAAAGLGTLAFLGAKYIWGKEVDPSKAEILELREKNFRPTKELVIPPTRQKLPDFLEKRLTPLVLEQWVEKDSVTDDGSLNEPHKVWRIKRTPELIPSAK
jgi:hypothetical protein